MGVDGGTYGVGWTGNAAELNWDEPFAPSSATATANIRGGAASSLNDALRYSFERLNAMPPNMEPCPPPTYGDPLDSYDHITKAQYYGGFPYRPEEKEEEMIDETQICKLDAMRKARNEVAEYLQAKHDRAALMRIQAAALEDEVAYGYGQINEDMPMPVDQPMADD